MPTRRFSFSRRTFLKSVLAAMLPSWYWGHRYVTTSGPDLSRYPVIFQRSGAASTAVAQVLMVGDVSMARGTAQTIADQGGDFDYPLSDVADWLHAADLAVGNQEGVIAPKGTGTERPMGYRLRAEPPAAAALARAGFGLLGLANNHARDYGPVGIAATMKALHDAGIQTVGVGENYRAARQATVTPLKGVKVAWLAYTHVPDPPDYGIYWEGNGYGRARIEEDKLAAQIKAARDDADVLIVQFHWGIEYEPRPFETQIRIARAAVDAGASLVIGHHPHVIQTTEIYKNTLIMYSLGNFLFDQIGRSGMAAWVRLDQQGIIDVHALPVEPGVHPTWGAA